MALSDGLLGVAALEVRDRVVPVPGTKEVLEFERELAYPEDGAYVEYCAPAVKATSVNLELSEYDEWLHVQVSDAL